MYWQQKVEYTMYIDMDVEKNTFQGKQALLYTNNSPDTLFEVYYHLFFNAFQPNSMMDVRSRTIEDPDGRVGSRIAQLNEDEIGYQKIVELRQDGAKTKFTEVGTILEVELAQPILPGETTELKMEFVAQVPQQIRRSGRDNSEGIRYSMTQWYPKLSEYDHEGWHPYSYVGREFHGVWGDFDVVISIDGSYVLGATGTLVNPEEIGKGYSKVEIESKENSKLKWHFKADNVHDFAWVADPDYSHTTAQLENGTVLHFLYQADSNTTNWDSLPKYAVEIFNIMNENFGKYPYKQYTVAQGGDGGMEYPMITLITGHRSKRSLTGVTAHEAIHSWYQHLLATNEAKYPWMDEGFTSYATNYVLAEIWPDFTPYQSSYSSYYNLLKAGKQEPLTTHADYFKTNRAYGVAAYSMGLIFLNQLKYIVGEDILMKGMKRYFKEWKYKHPTANDFIRIIEKEAKMELNWYLKQWIESTNTIDYGIKWLEENDEKTTLTLERKGDMPMPLDVRIELKNGDEQWINIPLRGMRGEKAAEKWMKIYGVAQDWPWTFPTYDLTLENRIHEIESIEIDPSRRMADIDRSNNVYPSDRSTTFRD